MAGVNGIVGTKTLTEKSVVTDQHPVVNQTFALKANNGTLEAGTILALNASGTAEAYDPTATEGSPLLTPVGVLRYTADTTRDTAGVAVVHGVLIKKALIVAGGDAADDDDITALKTALSVWVA